MEGRLIQTEHVNQKGFKSTIFEERNGGAQRIFLIKSTNPKFINKDVLTRGDVPYIKKTFFNCNGFKYCLCKATAFSHPQSNGYYEFTIVPPRKSYTDDIPNYGNNIHHSECISQVHKLERDNVMNNLVDTAAQSNDKKISPVKYSEAVDYIHTSQGDVNTLLCRHCDEVSLTLRRRVKRTFPTVPTDANLLTTTWFNEHAPNSLKYCILQQKASEFNSIAANDPNYLLSEENLDKQFFQFAHVDKDRNEACLVFFTRPTITKCFEASTVTMTQWDLKVVGDCLRQKNSFDCGVFVIKFADLIYNQYDISVKCGEMSFTAQEARSYRQELSTFMLAQKVKCEETIPIGVIGDNSADDDITEFQTSSVALNPFQNIAVSNEVVSDMDLECILTPPISSTSSRAGVASKRQSKVLAAKRMKYARRSLHGNKNI